MQREKRGNQSALPCQCEVVPMVLQGFVILLQVEVGITQLAVDGTKDLQVLGSNLDGRFKERHTGMIVTGLTEPLTLQGQVQT